PRDADDVRLLEGVVADELGRDLTGDRDDGRRVHHRVGEAGDEVRRAGAARGHANADFARGAGVAFRGVRRALLVAHEDVVDALPLLVELVVHVEDRAAGVAEDDVYTFANEALHHDARAAHRLAHGFYRARRPTAAALRRLRGAFAGCVAHC